ncbi:MAG: outer membrane beta-barrel protein [Bryobacteraceae bacterium]
MTASTEKVRSVRTLAWRLSMALLTMGVAPAQKHEIGLTLGRISGPTRDSAAGALSLDAGTALQANYGRRLFGSERYSLAFEVHFLANPQRKIGSLNSRATRDVATLYVTPGIRVKLRGRRVAPYAAIGAGYALYEQSLMQIDGSANAAPRHIHRGALAFGGGADIAVWRWFGLRGEVRDFYTGNPAFNAPVSGGQHNVVVGGGFVLSFGKRE